MSGLSVFHLVDDENNPIIDAYWNINEAGEFVESVSAIARRFSITPSQVSQLARRAHVELNDRSCPTCAAPIVVSTRTEYNTALRQPATVCGDCVRRDQEERAAAVAETLQRRQALLIQRYPTHNLGDDFDIEDLCLLEALILASWFRSDDALYAGSAPSIEELDAELTPSLDLTLEIIRALFQRRIICIHPSSNLNAFVWEDDDDFEQFYLTKANFQLYGSGRPVDRAKRFVNHTACLYSYVEWPEKWRGQLTATWEKLAVHECEEYLVFALGQHNLEFNPGPQTRELFQRIVKRFSVAEIYYFIWLAAKQASSYYVTRDVSKKRAANSAIGKISSLADKAYAESWELKPFRRDSRLPWSGASTILNSALSLPDPLAFHPDQQRKAQAKRLNWVAISDSDFERLLYDILNQASTYSNVDWLLHTNAPDKGRDISAFRTTEDELSGQSRERVIVQCKHWQSKPVRDEHIYKELASVSHWDDPPVDVLVIATSGKFTEGAVSFVEKHNGERKRPKLEIWNDAKLETLLSTRRHLVLEYGLL